MKRILLLFLTLAFCLSMFGFRNAPVSNVVDRLEGKQVGDVVSYGSYPMTATGEMGEIEWIVIQTSYNTVTLMSRYALDVKKYNNDNSDTPWEDSTLNAWLQSSFAQTAFTTEEQAMLQRIRMLTVEEAESMPRELMKCTLTPYADQVKKGIHATGRTNWWWLQDYLGENISRDGKKVYCAVYVTTDGKIGKTHGGAWTTFSGVAVRPVIEVRLTDENPVSAFFGSLEVGSEVTFGNYYNDSRSKKEPVQWITLTVQDGKALLLAKDGLDFKPYNDEDRDIIWEYCSLRDWLNTSFYNIAFSQEEKGYILLSNNANPSGGTARGDRNTKDLVFLLSLEEAERYFDGAEARICYPTQYAIDQGVPTELMNNGYGGDACWWYLRTPGSNLRRVANIRPTGDVQDKGGFVIDGKPKRAIRPAVWVTLGEAQKTLPVYTAPASTPKPSTATPTPSPSTQEPAAVKMYRTSMGDIKVLQYSNTDTLYLEDGRGKGPDGKSYNRSIVLGPTKDYPTEYVTYGLDKQFDTFSFAYYKDPNNGPYDYDVTLYVYADGKKIFEAKDFSNAKVYKKSLNVSGVSELKIEARCKKEYEDLLPLVVIADAYVEHKGR